MGMMYLREKELDMLKQAIDSKIAELMTEVNTSRYRYPEEEGELKREELYQMMDDYNDLWERLYNEEL